MGYTVMIVDDSDTIRAMLVRTLGMTKLPFDDILTACNGIEALEQLREHWIDLVFTDLHMPQMGGIELLETMQSEPSLNEIPVVIVSTEGSSTRIQELKVKGIKGYVRKPFTPEGIRDIILEILGGWEK
jgi:two-component system, chemotaxis family, chemotaxis protein CheY